MRHTLVAAFATPTDASRTYGDLMSRGIPRTQIHTVGADSAEIHAYDAPYSTADSTVDRTHHESKVAHFFKSLFGHEPHDDHRRHATVYPDAVRRGATVIAVDVHDDDQLVRARDALEYNGAIDINERGAGATDSGALEGYAGPTSPYAGATGGDSHLDKHFVRPGSSVAATDRSDIGSAAKRAGTDYPDTTATTHPTGAGTTGHGTSTNIPNAAPAVAPSQAETCGDRVCVIRRPG